MKTILLLFILVSASAFSANLPKEIERFDISYYMPQRYSLGDLVFDVEVEGLKEKLTQQKRYGKIDELYFRVYWMAPYSFSVDVMGIKGNFKELRNSLKSIVLSRVEYVIPRSLTEQFSGFEFKPNGAQSFLGSDPTGKSFINEISVKFSTEGKLERLKIISPTGTRISSFEMGPKNFSKNKWLIEKVAVEIYEGLQVSKIENVIEYKDFEGFAFPGKLTIKSEIRLNKKEKDKKNDDPVVKETLVYKFRNYQINSGKAKAVIRKAK